MLSTYLSIIPQGRWRSAHRRVRLGISLPSITHHAACRLGHRSVRVRPSGCIALRVEFQSDADADHHSHSRIDDHIYTIAYACPHVHACSYVDTDGDPYALAVTLSYAHAHTSATTISYFDACKHAISNPHSHREPNANHHSSTHTTYPNAYTNPHAYSHSHTHATPVPTSPCSQEHRPTAASHSHADSDAPLHHHFVPQSYLHAVSNAYSHAYPHCSASKDGPEFHRSGWTAFMRPSFRRFARLLGQ